VPEIRALVLDRAVLRLLQSIPKEANAEYNRSLRTIGGLFMRKFTSERLRKGVIEVHRKGSPKRAGLFIPLKARLAGFTGRLEGQKGLERKRVRLGTRNPVMIAHETGAIIRPIRAEYLRLRFRTFAIATRAEGISFIFSKLVRLPARLGFIATWLGFQPTARFELEKALDRSLKRASANAQREARKAESPLAGALGRALSRIAS